SWFLCTGPSLKLNMWLALGAAGALASQQESAVPNRAGAGVQASSLLTQIRGAVDLIHQPLGWFTFLSCVLRHVLRQSSLLTQIRGAVHLIHQPLGWFTFLD